MHAFTLKIMLKDLYLVLILRPLQQHLIVSPCTPVSTPQSSALRLPPLLLRLKSLFICSSASPSRR